MRFLKHSGRVSGRVAVIFAALVATRAAMAVTASGPVYPADAQPLVQLFGQVYDDNFNVTAEAIHVNNVTSDSIDGGTSFATFGAVADLANGTVRSKAIGNGARTASGSAAAFDFVNFNASGSSANIAYSLTIDGTQFNTDPLGSTSVTAEAAIFDVTGLSTAFSDFPDDTGRKFIAQPRISSAFVNHTIAGFGDSSPDNVVDSSGAIFPFSATLDGSFTALADHVYAVEIQISSSFAIHTGLTAASDFSHTAAFVFTDLDGSTFQSASGVFLSQPVPEPATSAGVLGSILVLGVRRRSRR